jgi:hypothetical protein
LSRLRPLGQLGQICWATFGPLTLPTQYRPTNLLIADVMLMWPLLATLLMWVWDAGAPQLSIGVPRTGIVPHVRIAYLSYTTTFPL